MLNAYFYDQGKTTIILLPLLAMHEEYTNRAKAHGLSVETWKSQSSPHSPPQILLVAVEKCVWDTFLVYAWTLIIKGQMARFIVDEAHLLVKHKSFRPCLNLLGFLGSLPISIVLLTATCPPSLESSLFEKVGRVTYQVLRQGTDRPEISQYMVKLDSSENQESVVAKRVLDLERTLVGMERMLLFCNSREECDRMAGLLRWKSYHSDVPLEDRSKFMKMWKEGTTIGLVSTSMLNCCLDYPSVRYVFHLDAPRDAMDYYQAIGRCARNGNFGTSVVYYVPRTGQGPTGDDPFGKRVIWEMLHGKNTGDCRRVAPGEFLDGFSVPCNMQQRPNFCDNCSKASSPARPHVSHVTSAGSSRTIHLPNDPAPAASFGNLMNATLSSMRQTGPPSVEQQLALRIRQACDTLANCCVRCWLFKVECLSHRLVDCKHFTWEGAPKEWADDFSLPPGSCYYCGGPQKVRQSDPAGRNILNMKQFAFRSSLSAYQTICALFTNIFLTTRATGSISSNHLLTFSHMRLASKPCFKTPICFFPKARPT